MLPLENSGPFNPSVMRKRAIYSIMRWLIEFFFPRRLHRLAYFLRGLVLDTVMSFLYAINSTMNPLGFWAWVVVLATYVLFFIILPRLRDAGMSAWWLLTCFVPVADIVFSLLRLFRPPAHGFGKTASVIEPAA